MFWEAVFIWISVIAEVSLPLRHSHQYLLKGDITFVPRSKKEFKEQTKDIKCENGNGSKLYLTYVINPFHNGTSLGCFQKKQIVTKKCLEYNYKNRKITIQESIGAPCDIFTITPCNYEYESPDSYKIYECFEKYGGILPPFKRQEKIKYLDQTKQNLTKHCTEMIEKKDDKIKNLQKENIKFKNSSCNGIVFWGFVCCGVLLLGFLFILIIYLIPFLIQKIKYERRVNIEDLFKSRSILIKKIILSNPSDICRENNQSADADPMIKMKFQQKRV